MDVNRQRLERVAASLWLWLPLLTIPPVVFDWPTVVQLVLQGIGMLALFGLGVALRRRPRVTRATSDMPASQRRRRR